MSKSHQVHSAILVLVLAIAGVPSAIAQEFRTPLAITGATVTVGPGETIEQATILVDNGRIAAVGAGVAIPEAAERFDATGLWAYAGFIDAATHLGIEAKGPSDEEMARLRDRERAFSEGPHTNMEKANRQDVWPHLSLFDLYKQNDEALKAHRAAGFTTALISPRAAILGGQGDVVQLGGKALRQSILAPSVTQIASFGADLEGEAFRTRQYPGSPMGAVALLRQTYYDAEWYRQRQAQYQRFPTQVERVPDDPVLEAMGALLDRRQMWIFEANTPNEIHHALDLAEEFHQRIAILGGREAWKVAGRLAAAKTSVIVSFDWKDKPELSPKVDEKRPKTEYTTVSWAPEFEKDFFEPLAVRRARIQDWEDHVNNLHALIAAGVPVAVSSRDNKDAKEFWKRAQEALGLALEPNELVAALTTGPAAIYGLHDQIGRVAPGYLADLTLLTKPLGEKGAQARHVFIDGNHFTFETSDKPVEDEKKDGAAPAEANAADAGAPPGETTPAEEKKEEKAPDDRHPWEGETPADRVKPIETHGSVLLRHARVLTVANGILDDTDVLVVDGRISEIGRGLAAPDGVAALDLTGYWLSPGIVDPHSHLAVTGVNEWTQSITCEVRQADVIDQTQLAVHRAVAGGVTTIHTMHGSANTIGGQNAVLKLKYNTSPADMLVTTGPRLVKFALGENVTRARNTPRYPNSRMGVESVLRQAFNAALEYDKLWKDYTARTAQGQVVAIPRRDLRLEALRDILAGGIWVHSHCYRADEMLRLLAVAQDYGFRVATLQHVLEGYRVAPEMFNHGVAGSTFSDWWSYKTEAFEAIPYNAAMMMRAGIVTSLNSDSSEVIRHLNLEAAKTMRFGGVTADEAMRLVTLNPAIQIGVDSRIGSIEVGKDGDFAVFTRHPLDAFAKNVMTLIEGEVFFAYPGSKFDGSAPGPNRAEVPQPPRGPLHLERLAASRVYAITGAHVHPVVGDEIPMGTVLLRDGKIEAIGAGLTLPADAVVVDAAGLHVYPGLINSASQLGLVEIEGIPQTVDARELASFQPDLKALSAINPHSEHLPVSFCEGVTTAHVLPSGGVISGRAAFVQLLGWTLPEMLREGETGLVIELPVLPDPPLDLPDDKKTKRLDEHRAKFEDVEAFMREAQNYARARSVPGAQIVADVRLEAMAPYVRGEKPVYFRADSYKSILQALRFAEVFGLKPVIVGGGEAWKCAKLLAEKGVPVIVTSVFSEPTGKYDRFDAFYTNPARLEQAGVLFSIASDGAQYARQLPIHAGYAVAYGLSPEAALRAVTINAAKILRLDAQVGSIEPGKTADVIITTGDPLQANTRTVGMFMAGKPIELTSLHERNYERFSNRPAPKLPPVGELRGPKAMHTQPAAPARMD
jgi:imidazolonepropionase-like amidohydrolase